MGTTHHFLYATKVETVCIYSHRAAFGSTGGGELLRVAFCAVRGLSLGGPNLVGQIC